MKLLTKAQHDKLVKNHTANLARYEDENLEQDHKPVVKFFGGGACTWLISELDPESNIAFGLCDLGMGTPELGYVSLDELASIKFPPFGLPVERDLSFTADKTITEYANEARELGRIAA